MVSASANVAQSLRVFVRLHQVPTVSNGVHSAINVYADWLARVGVAASDVT